MAYLLKSGLECYITVTCHHRQAWLAPLLCSQEVLSSNFSWETGCSKTMVLINLLHQMPVQYLK